MTLTTDAVHLLLHVYRGTDLNKLKLSPRFFVALPELHTQQLVRGSYLARTIVLTERGEKYMQMLLDTPLPVQSGWVDPREVLGK